MRRTLIFVFLLFAILPNSILAQEQAATQSLFRITSINPAIEYEQAIFRESIYTARAGWGLSGSYQNLNEGFNSGWVYMLVPFANMEYKWLYDRNKRANKNKNIQYNSGNYLGCRFEYRGKATRTNISRLADDDFSIGPMWGMQRAVGRLHFLFDLGGVYYFDTKGNDGLMCSVRLRLGINLSDAQ